MRFCGKPQSLFFFAPVARSLLKQLVIYTTLPPCRSLERGRASRFELRTAQIRGYSVVRNDWLQGGGARCPQRSIPGGAEDSAHYNNCRFLSSCSLSNPSIRAIRGRLQKIFSFSKNFASAIPEKGVNRKTNVKLKIKKQNLGGFLPGTVEWDRVAPRGQIPLGALYHLHS